MIRIFLETFTRVLLYNFRNITQKGESILLKFKECYLNRHKTYKFVFGIVCCMLLTQYQAVKMYEVFISRSENTVFIDEE